MGIEKRETKNKTVYVAYVYIKDINNRRKRIWGEYKDTKKEANAEYIRLYSSLISGDIPKSSMKNFSFYKLGQDFLFSRKLKEDEVSTLRFYNNILNKYLFPAIGHLNVDKITPDFLMNAFSRFREHRFQNGAKISQKQYNHIVKTLRTVLNYGMKNMKCSFNPANAIETIKIAEQPFTFMEKEKVIDFLTFVKGNKRSYLVPYYVYLVGFNLGLRIGEIIGLKWNKIDFENKSIMISEIWDKTVKVIKKYTKSKKYRILFMNEVIENALREIKVIYPNSEYVFPNYSSNGHINYRNFYSRMFKKDIEEFGIKNFDLHGMRHTFAILYLMNKGYPQDLQLILGHESITTTMRYVKFANDYLKSKTSIVELEARVPEGVSKLHLLKK